MHMLCMYFHSRCISEGSFCRARLRSSISGWRHRSDRKDPKGQGTPCGHCRHRVHARIPRAFKMLMASEFCPLIFCLLVDITSCIHGLCAGNPSDLNEWLLYSSQTAYIRPVIAHVHPPGDVNRSIRGLPNLRVLGSSTVRVSSKNLH